MGVGNEYSDLNESEGSDLSRSGLHEGKMASGTSLQSF